MMKLPGGRPTKRTDRWYALLALIYVTADELRRTFLYDNEWGSWGRRWTGRSITAKLVSLDPNTVTNALTQAKARKLFIRERLPKSRFASRAPNRPGGRLTEHGWQALGPVAQEWHQRFGHSWKIDTNPLGEVVTGEDAHEALAILVTELHAEEELPRR